MIEGQTGDRREAPKWRGILQIVVIAAVILAAILLARAPRQEYLELDSEAGQTGRRTDGRGHAASNDQRLAQRGADGHRDHAWQRDRDPGSVR